MWLKYHLSILLRQHHDPCLKSLLLLVLLDAKQKFQLSTTWRIPKAILYYDYLYCTLLTYLFRTVTSIQNNCQYLLDKIHLIKINRHFNNMDAQTQITATRLG